MLDRIDVREQVKEYYGARVQKNSDLACGSCCCASASLPAHLRNIAVLIDEEIHSKFYGCGSPIPPELAGQTVLDLGCGTGRDAYVVSKLVGPEGRVIGIDMTEPQLEVARRHLPEQMRRFDFAQPNVDFRQGYIEDLAEAGIADDSVDVVISNCVINLSPDKRRVFSEVFRVLKPGGELYFSDILAGRRVPAALREDPVLRGECLSGAMYIEDFRRTLREVGCADYRVVSRSRVSLDNTELAWQIGMIDFHAMTIRAFKLDSLEDACEDYGQVAIYRGTLPESPHLFVLDDHHGFQAGKPTPVCGNTAAMLQETRYGRHFTVLGDRSRHYGLFQCVAAAARDPLAAGPGGACC